MFTRFQPPTAYRRPPRSTPQIGQPARQPFARPAPARTSPWQWSSPEPRWSASTGTRTARPPATSWLRGVVLARPNQLASSPRRLVQHLPTDWQFGAAPSAHDRLPSRCLVAGQLNRSTNPADTRSCASCLFARLNWLHRTRATCWGAGRQSRSTISLSPASDIFRDIQHNLPFPWRSARMDYLVLVIAGERIPG